MEFFVLQNRAISFSRADCSRAMVDDVQSEGEKGRN